MARSRTLGLALEDQGHYAADTCPADAAHGKGIRRGWAVPRWRMANGHAERTLAAIRVLEQQTAELLISLPELDAEQSSWLREMMAARAAGPALADRRRQVRGVVDGDF